MSDDRLTRIEDAQFQKKLEDLKTMSDPAKETEIEARIEQQEAATGRAAEAMRQAVNPPVGVRQRPRSTNRSKNRATGRRRAAKDSAPAKLTERKLLVALLDAETAEDICTAVARWCWWKTNDGTECPVHRIPVWDELIWWWNHNESISPTEEMTRALGAVLGEGALWMRHSEVGGVVAVVAGSDRPLTFVEVHNLWRKASSKLMRRHPLAPVVCSWQSLTAVPVRMTGKPTLIMPRTVAHVESTADRHYLARFGRAVHRDPKGQLFLDFATDEERGPTLPANVWTMGLATAEKRGAVVPLALRIWVAAILHTPLHARHGRHPVELDDLTLRKFLTWVYTGRTMPKPIRYWPRIMAAREVINSTELPFEWRGNLWARPIVILATPLTRPGLDDPWPVTVHLPPGDGTGPAINFSRLQYWSIRNAACYRALINLAYRWHIEGKRLMPIRHRNHWLQLRDPTRYDCIEDADAEAICYPPGTGARRRDQRRADAYAALEELVKAGDATAVEGRLLPPPPPRVRTGT